MWIWCRGRDLNPGHGLERPAYLAGLYYRGTTRLRAASWLHSWPAAAMKAGTGDRVEGVYLFPWGRVLACLEEVCFPRVVRAYEEEPRCVEVFEPVARPHGVYA